MNTEIELFLLLLSAGYLVFICFYPSSKIKSGFKENVLKKTDFPGWALFVVSFFTVSFGHSVWRHLESGRGAIIALFAYGLFMGAWGIWSGRMIERGKVDGRDDLSERLRPTETGQSGLE